MTEQADKEMLKAQQDLEGKTLNRIESLEDKVEKIEILLNKLYDISEYKIVSGGKEGNSER